MHVGNVHRAAAHARGHRRHQPAASPIAHAVPQPGQLHLASSTTPATGPVSRAGGEWPVNQVRAQADAQRALNAIDWSQKDIVLWVPGTDNHAVNPSFEAAVKAAWTKGGLSLTKVDYEASWNMRPSVATGIETLRLVLAGIAAHGGSHRVMIAGESQGAWIIGEALADPMLRGVVNRAVLMGHPWLAAHHYDGQNGSNVIEVNHAGDEVASAINGDAAKALDAMVAIHQINFGKIGTVVSALVHNPMHGVMLLQSLARWAVGGGLLADPHDYRPDMAAAVKYLGAIQPAAIAA